MGLTLRRPPSSEVSVAEVSRAWARYLREIRDAGADDYPVIEERAWHRLVSSLEALGAPVEQLRTRDV
jgi:hypothetical protein